MTEAEWQVCTDPQVMLAFLRGKVSDRKLRLFAVACCRRIRHLITDECCQRAVGLAEVFADGLATQEELDALRMRAANAYTYTGARAPTAADFSPSAAIDCTVPNAETAARSASSLATSAACCAAADPINDSDYDATYAKTEEGETAAQADLLRDMVGLFLFRSVILDRAWLTSPSPRSPNPFTTTAPSTVCRFWPLPSKTPAATTLRFWSTAGRVASMSEGAGLWI
jgi:hypothetical protein